jgi:hypothetical protein
LYGGNVSPDNRILDDLWILSLDNVAWQSKNLELPGIVWSKVDHKGGFAGRRGHGAVAHPNMVKLIVFGGILSNNEFSNDLGEFDNES